MKKCEKMFFSTFLGGKSSILPEDMINFCRAFSSAVEGHQHHPSSRSQKLHAEALRRLVGALPVFQVPNYPSQSRSPSAAASRHEHLFWTSPSGQARLRAARPSGGSAGSPAPGCLIIPCEGSRVTHGHGLLRAFEYYWSFLQLPMARR